MRASTKRFTSLLIALLLVALTITVSVSFLAPALTAVSDLRGRISAQNELLATQDDAVERFQNLLALYSDQYRTIDETLRGALPTREDVPSAVNQIQALSRASNLPLQSLTFRYAPLRPQSRTAQTSLLSKPIGTLNITFQAAGTYEAGKAFLRALETNIRLMDVKTLKIDPVRRGEEIAPNLFLYTVEVATYYQ